MFLWYVMMILRSTTETGWYCLLLLILLGVIEMTCHWFTIFFILMKWRPRRGNWTVVLNIFPTFSHRTCFSYVSMVYGVYWKQISRIGKNRRGNFRNCWNIFT